MDFMYLFLAIVVLLSIWSVWGYMSSNTEQTQYSVLAFRQDYEMRLYPAHIVAETTVQGPYQNALNQGFRIIAGYIFGGNKKSESISMTAPVVAQKVSEKIAMTAPVVASIDGEAHTVAFGMPRSYSLETLPTPNDPRVKIVEIPEKKMAAIRFSWVRTSGRVESKKAELLAALKRDNAVILGQALYAGYNAPWTPPWMVRNEVLVEVA